MNTTEILKTIWVDIIFSVEFESQEWSQKADLGLGTRELTEFQQ